MINTVISTLEKSV